MKDLIKDIINSNNIEEIYNYAVNELFTRGPVSSTVLEILTYLCIYQTEFFETVKEDVLEIMGVFYKKPEARSLKALLFEMYGDYIIEEYKYSYTPVQANIIENIENNMNFSFSAPTSTGKSFVFRNIIEKSTRDIVIVVPSRALINEYYDKVNDIIKDKKVNILTFVDIINTKHANRSIFILTPERAKELFKYKQSLNIELFLFDEAQLSNENSSRGLYFDSIIRRVQKNFNEAKCVFAHPFVANPEAQLKKNNFDLSESNFEQYLQKNVGQIYYAHKDNKYYHFGIDKSIMGSTKQPSSFDPLEKVLNEGGSILIYTTKSSIYSKKIFNKFKKYIDMCTEIIDEEALAMIGELKNNIGSSDSGKYYHSLMIELIRKGIVTHHGSLPLQARLILEHFTQKGFCKICFATSTLEQGINMPFDIVYLNLFERSKPLAVKNLIGRAGRSTNSMRFDYGSVVMHVSKMSGFRVVLGKEEVMKEISLLDVKEDNSDYEEFKDAINNDSFSDEYNLTDTELERLSGNDINIHIKNLLDSMFQEDGRLISLASLNRDDKNNLRFYKYFLLLYRHYLGGRELSDGEESVLNTAIRILIWRVHGKSFKQICRFRYAYVARIQERKDYEEMGWLEAANNLESNFIRQYADIPNRDLPNYSIYERVILAKDVDYDRIVFDTYDYLDKLISFKLSDIFYAVFHKYYERTKDIRSEKLALYFRYGTDDEKSILLLRYGFTFDDIEWLKIHISKINTEEITFLPSIENLTEDKKRKISRYSW